MGNIKDGKVERLLRTVDIIKQGKKPMSAKAFAPLYGDDKNCYEFNGTYYKSSDELSKALEEYETIEGRPNIILIYSHIKDEIS
jgi:hypothetical protein